MHIALPLGLSREGSTNVGTARTAAAIQGFILDLSRPPKCPSDLNGDGEIGAADLLSVRAAWGAATASSDDGGDGTVDAAELWANLVTRGGCPRALEPSSPEALEP